MDRRKFLTVSVAAVAGVAAAPAFAGGHGRLGEFTGKSNHITTGTAELVKTGDGYVIELHSNFDFDGAPDPKVALSRDGYSAGDLIAPLAKNKGAQKYKVPASFDAANANEVWIWCEKFNVPLGVAKLN